MFGLSDALARDWLLHPVMKALKRIIMNQAELAQSLNDLKTQADKAKAEIVKKVADLETAITNAGNSTPEVDAALANLKGSVQGLDDLNPDAAPPAPPTEPTEPPAEPPTEPQA